MIGVARITGYQIDARSSLQYREGGENQTCQTKRKFFPHFGFMSSSEGVFLVKMKHAFEPVKRDNSVNTYSRISTVPRGSERSE